jgi:uncharacterized protein YwgA
MTLLLTGERSQAILALAIKEARDAADAHGGYVGRTAIQKIMYFLKAQGVAMRYRFDIHHYGPFCQDILTDTEWLIADYVIADSAHDGAKYSSYRSGPAMDEILDLLKDMPEEERTVIRDTATVLVQLPVDRLELLATLDYLLRAERATGKKKGLKKAVVDRFLEVKKNKFDQNDVEQAYELVAKLGTRAS